MGEKKKIVKRKEKKIRAFPGKMWTLSSYFSFDNPEPRAVNTKPSLKVEQYVSGFQRQTWGSKGILRNYGLMEVYILSKKEQVLVKSATFIFQQKLDTGFDLPYILKYKSTRI